MWVLGSIVFLIPAMYITLKLLSPRNRSFAMRNLPGH
jgi:hypothetical protein